MLFTNGKVQVSQFIQSKGQEFDFIVWLRIETQRLEPQVVMNNLMTTYEHTWAPFTPTKHVKINQVLKLKKKKRDTDNNIEHE